MTRRLLLRFQKEKMGVKKEERSVTEVQVWRKQTAIGNKLARYRTTSIINKINVFETNVIITKDMLIRQQSTSVNIKGNQYNYNL